MSVSLIVTSDSEIEVGGTRYRCAIGKAGFVDEDEKKTKTKINQMNIKDSNLLFLICRLNKPLMASQKYGSKRIGKINK